MKFERFFSSEKKCAAPLALLLLQALLAAPAAAASKQEVDAAAHYLMTFISFDFCPNPDGRGVQLLRYAVDDGGGATVLAPGAMPVCEAWVRPTMFGGPAGNAAYLATHKTQGFSDFSPWGIEHPHEDRGLAGHF